MKLRQSIVALWVCSAPALASQIVVTEVTYTHSGTTTSDSHLRVAPLPGNPTNWRAPVDYASGTAVVRLEVFTKPTNTPTRFQICFEGTPSYACTDQAPSYSQPGVYTWTTQFSNFYQYTQVDWTKPISKVALILKDTMNGKPSPENVGATTSALYMPTNLRVTLTLVSPGGTYVPPLPPDAGVADAGVADAGGADAGIADAGMKDAGVAVDAGVDAGGFVDAPTDGGSTMTPDLNGGCGCSGGSGGLALFGLALLLRRTKRRVE